MIHVPQRRAHAQTSENLSPCCCSVFLPSSQRPTRELGIHRHIIRKSAATKGTTRRRRFMFGVTREGMEPWCGRTINRRRKSKLRSTREIRLSPLGFLAHLPVLQPQIRNGQPLVWSPDMPVNCPEHSMVPATSVSAGRLHVGKPIQERDTPRTRPRKNDRFPNEWPMIPGQVFWVLWAIKESASPVTDIRRVSDKVGCMNR